MLGIHKKLIGNIYVNGDTNHSAGDIPELLQLPREPPGHAQDHAGVGEGGEPPRLLRLAFKARLSITERSVMICFSFFLRIIIIDNRPDLTSNLPRPNFPLPSA